MSHKHTMKPVISLGTVVATPGVMASVTAEELRAALRRHASGDWGLVDKRDKWANDLAAKKGDRVLSAYLARAGVKFWIISEGEGKDRVTTALLPDEY